MCPRLPAAPSTEPQHLAAAEELFKTDMELIDSEAALRRVYELGSTGTKLSAKESSSRPRIGEEFKNDADAKLLIGSDQRGEGQAGVTRSLSCAGERPGDHGRPEAVQEAGWTNG